MFTLKSIFHVVFVPLVMLGSGCGDDSVVRNITTEYLPMWPQHGFNARQTGNPNSSNVSMNPVIEGVPDWSYSFPAGGYTDGSEFCVDSKGDIYFISEEISGSSLYKFSPEGIVIWKKDSIVATNFSAISLNRKEDRIYFVSMKNGLSGLWLHCVDSSGNFIWSRDSAYFTQKVVARGDGNLCCFIGNKLSCLSPDGKTIWAKEKYGFMEGSRPALDNQDNLYFATFTGIAKTDKDGNLKWSKAFSGRPLGITIDGYGNAYFIPYDNNTLYSITPDGNLRWTASGSNSFCIPVIGKDNRIYMTYFKDSIYIAALDTSGKTIWKTRSFTQFGNTVGPEGMLLDDYGNLYYIASHYGIYAESLDQNGNLRWTSGMLLNAETLSFPVLLPQGRLLICPKRGFKIQAVR
ncbi:MAG: PQQ-binding-like beta-propeller repeat protein [Bacteroidetes bacterium]|nr:PQQ-binding-like beta-propeller repeat protein [Bacteroidota bacterium]